MRIEKIKSSLKKSGNKKMVKLFVSILAVSVLSIYGDPCAHRIIIVEKIVLIKI